MKEGLSEEELRALRGSKFAPLPAPRPPSTRTQPRLAHPGGPVTTNKAAALAKFLERKLQQPGGLESINPDLLQVAVDNAKETVKISSHGGASSSGRVVRHVSSFGDSSEGSGEDRDEIKEMKLNKKKKRRKGKKQKKKMAKSPKCNKTTKMKKSKS